MTIPRILIIDDQFGWALNSRRDLCAMYGLRDATGDDAQPEVVSDAIAEATFCSAQVKTVAGIENEIKRAMDVTREGWPFADGARWALVLLDLRFVTGRHDDTSSLSGRPGDDEFGLRILEALRHELPELPVVIFSSRVREEVIEQCRRLGAADYIQLHAGTDRQAPREVLAAKLWEYGLLEDEKGIVVGRSLALLTVLAAARRAATGGGNILILGESGTGKELLARYIHDHSPKASGPYKIFHAFGTVESLQEDLLFGHVKGAFTDAKTDRAGLFELASGGTLFIDEIADIPEVVQNKLLRPIETRRVSRQGRDEEIQVDVQLVLATNKALDDYTESGRFKSDLLNRIRAYPLTLPPLRERREDIPMLAQHLLQLLCREHGARWPRTLNRDALDKLLQHDWSEGNVRELRNVLERVVKDNKDAEIVVAGDIRFDTPLGKRQTVGAAGVSGSARTVVGSRDGAGQADTLRGIKVEPDYERLHGSWPLIEREIAYLLARNLAAAIEVTRRRRAGGPAQGEINVTGAVSCLMGEQVSPIKAFDFVKRLLQFDPDSCDQICREFPELGETLERALRNRPKKRKGQSTGLEDDA